jgi:glutaminyl-tRNA synthetase
MKMGAFNTIYATHFPNSKSGSDTSEIHVKGTIHWVSIPHAVEAEIRSFDRLLIVEDASELGDDFMKFINPESIQITEKAFVERSLRSANVNKAVQFIRKGYYCLDPDASCRKTCIQSNRYLKRYLGQGTK